jgi:hypothetical protein
MSDDTPPPRATEPIFINDHSSDLQQEISWIVGNDDTPDETVEKAPVEQEKYDEDLEDEDTQEDGQEDHPRKKRSNKVSSQRRIAELTRKLKEAESFAHTVLNQKEYLQKKLGHKEKESVANYENLLNNSKHQIKEAMIKAHEEGDSVLHAQASDLLNQYNTELMFIKKQKENGYYNQYDNLRSEIPQEIFNEPEEEIDDYEVEVYLDWTKKNSWANPKSRNFDPELLNEANEYSEILMKKYRLQGRKDDIGNPRFFDEITDFMNQSYGTSNNQEERPHRMQMRNPNTPGVAPVSRNFSNSQSSKTRSDIVLSPEQKQVAHAMRGYVRDKNGNKITSNSELESYYKNELRKGT